MFQQQTLRLVVHTSAGGSRLRIKISNTYGDSPLLIGTAHVGRRTSGADVDASTDRALTFANRASTTIAPRGAVVSDPVNLDFPALSDLAVSLFLPERTKVTTAHVLAKQTNYVSAPGRDATADAAFPIAHTITTWPFLTGVDVEASSRGATIVAFGSSTTDGDGSTSDANRRFPDILAQRLQADAGGKAELGMLNEGIIGNRLLYDIDSPHQAGGPFEDVLKRLGPSLGESGIRRFDRDVLEQAGVRYVILVLGINDILFPGTFTPAAQRVGAAAVIAGNRELIARAHARGIKAIGTTIPPFEDSEFTNPHMEFFSADKEQTRQDVNAWMRTAKELDGVVDFDRAVRDPRRPTRLRPEFDAGDHLHVNDAGNLAQANAFALALFKRSAR